MRRIAKLSLACLTVGLASACKTAELVHPTGFQPVGGVRFINDSIANGPAKTAGSTYQNLATINDGQPLGDY